MIDASAGFAKDGNKNRLRAQDIHKIVDVFNSQAELAGYSRMVPKAEIADPANDYNLNIPRYIDSSEPEDIHDLDAHLNGGIPDRDIDAWTRTGGFSPPCAKRLFGPNGRDGYSAGQAWRRLQVRCCTFVGHDEFATLSASRVTTCSAHGAKSTSRSLKAISTLTRCPGAVIDTCSLIDLLNVVSGICL